MDLTILTANLYGLIPEILHALACGDLFPIRMAHQTIGAALDVTKNSMLISNSLRNEGKEIMPACLAPSIPQLPAITLKPVWKVGKQMVLAAPTTCCHGMIHPTQTMVPITGAYGGNPNAHFTRERLSTLPLLTT